jgi:hypothetical protein
VLDWHGDTGKSGVTDRLPHLARKLLVAILAAPIVEAECGTDLSRRFGNHLLFVRETKFHAHTPRKFA